VCVCVRARVCVCVCVCVIVCVRVFVCVRGREGGWKQRASLRVKPRMNHSLHMFVGLHRENRKHLSRSSACCTRLTRHPASMHGRASAHPLVMRQKYRRAALRCTHAGTTSITTTAPRPHQGRVLRVSAATCAIRQTERVCACVSVCVCVRVCVCVCVSE
jgi:hypothetical protein